MGWFDNLTSSVSDVWGGLKKNASDAWHSTKGAVDQFRNAVGSAYDTATSIPYLGNAIRDFAHENGVAQAASAASNAWDKFTRSGDNLGGALGRLGDKAGGAGGRMRRRFQRALPL